MSRWQDSNLQHPGSKPDALPGCATPRLDIQLCASCPRHGTGVRTSALASVCQTDAAACGRSRMMFLFPSFKKERDIIVAFCFAQPPARAYAPTGAFTARGGDAAGGVALAARQQADARGAADQRGAGTGASTHGCCLPSSYWLPSRVVIYAPRTRPSSIHRRFFRVPTLPAGPAGAGMLSSAYRPAPVAEHAALRARSNLGISPERHAAPVEPRCGPRTLREHCSRHLMDPSTNFPIAAARPRAG